MSVRDVKPARFIAAYASHLKKANWLKLPTWVDLVKTGPGKQMCPLNPDWYYIRAAAIARQIYLKKGQGVGVGHLRRKFGGNKHRGPRPNRFVKASGAVIRHIVKQFVEIGVFEKSADGGRKISKEGMRDLDRIAARTLAPRKKATVNPNKAKKGTKSGSAKPKTKATATKPAAKTATKPAAKKATQKK